MAKIRLLLMKLTLGVILYLVFVSVLSSFYGASKASTFFNSPLMISVWGILLVLLVAGFVFFKSLIRRPGSFMLHLGCIFVLAGGMWGSATAHALRTRHFGSGRIYEGHLKITEGYSENRLLNADFTAVLGKLDFHVVLNDFTIEHYPLEERDGPIMVVEYRGSKQVFPARPGAVLPLPDSGPIITVKRLFDNFRMDLRPDGPIAIDDDGPGNNRAIQLELAYPDGTSRTHYLFASNISHQDSPVEGLHLRYLPAREPAVKAYLSSVILSDDASKQIGDAVIAVNHPLRFGGYNIYQTSYGKDLYGTYTVLQVKSDSGLLAVFAGYILLMAGMVYSLWVAPAISVLKRKGAFQWRGN